MRSVSVRESERHIADPVDLVIEEVITLRGHRLMPLTSTGMNGCAPVAGTNCGGHTAGATPKDDPGVVVVLRAPLEQRELAAAVDVDVRLRVGHRVDVPDLGPRG
jgi:hypothetical protein